MNVTSQVLGSFCVGVLCAACFACTQSEGPTGPSGPLGSDGEIPGTGADGNGGSGAASGAESGAADDMGGSPSSDGRGDEGGESGESGNGQGTAEAGVLTAGTWDDNLNFDFFSAYSSEISDKQYAGHPGYTDEEHRAANDARTDLRKSYLDISLVIDTTGSMGDEIRYLQVEFDALSSTIADRYPDAEQRWSLVTYRDQSDDYVVRWFDFREDLTEFQTKLAAQSANGGGDYPEAADEALEIANQLAWRSDPSVARLLFWVADAPHHDERAERLAAAVRTAATQDIHIYPVASSGVDELTEFSMRAAAQLTGGRYLFLTDDSGIGGAHKEPTLPCYFVTKLDDAILRMVDIELTGDYREPTEEEVIRVGGDPEHGVCTLSGGEQVEAF